MSWIYIETDNEHRKNIDQEIVALGGHVMSYHWLNGYVFESEPEMLSRFGDVREGPSPHEGGVQV